MPSVSIRPIRRTNSGLRWAVSAVGRKNDSRTCSTFSGPSPASASTRSSQAIRAAFTGATLRSTTASSRSSLVAEMIMHRGEVNFCCCNHLPQGSGGVPLLGEEPLGSIQNLFLGVAPFEH